MIKIDGMQFSILFLVLIGFNIFANVGAISPQDKMKNFTNRYISTFFTISQMYNMSKTIAVDFYKELPQDVMYTDVFNNVMATLTGTQLTQGASYILCLFFQGLNSQTAILSAVDVAATAIGKRLKAVYNETLAKVRSMKAVPRGVNAIYQQFYRIGAQFESQKNICILMSGAKQAMSTSNWAAFRKCLAPVIHFSNCNY